MLHLVRFCWNILADNIDTWARGVHELASSWTRAWPGSCLTRSDAWLSSRLCLALTWLTSKVFSFKVQTGLPSVQYSSVCLGSSFSSVQGTGAKCLSSVHLVQFIQFTCSSGPDWYKDVQYEKCPGILPIFTKFIQAWQTSKMQKTKMWLTDEKMCD